MQCHAPVAGVARLVHRSEAKIRPLAIKGSEARGPRVDPRAVAVLAPAVGAYYGAVEHFPLPSKSLRVGALLEVVAGAGQVFARGLVSRRAVKFDSAVRPAGVVSGILRSPTEGWVGSRRVHGRVELAVVGVEVAIGVVAGDWRFARADVAQAEILAELFARQIPGDIEVVERAGGGVELVHQSRVRGDVSACEPVLAHAVGHIVEAPLLDVLLRERAG